MSSIAVKAEEVERGVGGETSESEKLLTQLMAKNGINGKVNDSSFPPNLNQF